MKIIIDSKERRSFAANYIAHITADPLKEVIIQDHVEGHSDPQRGLFHAAVRELSKETGYTEGEVKELIKKEILGTKIIKIGDIEKEVTCSSEYDDDGKPRDKPSYSQLIDGLYRIASEAGITI